MLPEPGPDADLAGRAVRGSADRVLVAFITIPLGMARAILLARLLVPEHFGVVALALFFLQLSSTLLGFGLDSALLHRRDAGERVLATYFTMRMGVALLGSGLLVALAPLLGRSYRDLPLLGPVLIAYAIVGVLRSFHTAGETLLDRQLAFRRLAIGGLTSSIAMTVIAPWLAWQGWGVWSLVAELAVGASTRVLFVWGFRAPWRPRFGWDPAIARWFWRFGLRVWMSRNLGFLLDRFDDFWIGTFLGKTPLGYYAKAYELAGYPRRAVANPIVAVFVPIFARLADEPDRLSRAFFRMTGFILRLGFWVSLVFVLAAPELVPLVLGERWLPMTFTFQLMMLYVLLDPVVAGVAGLLTAIGRPGLIVRARLAQMAVFLPAVIVLGSVAGIEGVAIAADLMLAVGCALLFQGSRRFVRYSLTSLAVPPAAAVAISASVVFAGSALWAALPPLGALAGKSLLVTAVYWAVLFVVEGARLKSGFAAIWALMRSGSKDAKEDA